jgi:tetratricopeptide (TPR) repeat protein
VLLPLLLAASQAQATTRYESLEFGFRLERPAEWIVQSAKDQGEARFVFTVLPRGSLGNPSFVVYVYDRKAGGTLDAVADKAAKKLEAADVHDLDSGRATLGERELRWVRGRKDDERLGAYLVEYRFVASDDHLYALQSAVPPDDAATRAVLDRIAASCELFAAAPAARDLDRERLLRLAARCGTEIEWASDWESAAKSAKAQSKPILVLYENYAALDLPRTAASGPFMDPDLLELLRERFVAFRLEPGADAPFRDPEVFGIGPHAWGTTFLFVDPAGHVLRETSLHEPTCLLDAAREVLRSPDKLPEDGAGAAAHRARAACHRRHREGEEALEELRAARRSGDESLDRECDADEAVILMRLGRHEEARAAFEKIAAADPPSSRAPEAMFWLGAYEVLANSGKGPRTWWRRLVDEHEDDRWAWKAAANLLDAGALIRGVERLDWPAGDVLESARTPARKPLSASAPASLDRAESAAVAFLVESQREDGSWIVPADAFGLGPGLYTPAVTAICAASLVPAATSAGPAKQGAASAVSKALRHALDLRERGSLDAGSDLAGVYSIWGRTYVLALLARCSRAKIGDAAELDAAMSALLASIAGNQHVNGGWPYVFLPGDPSGENFDPSASFLTAGVVTVLLDARDCGVDVPEEVLDRALDFLDGLRQEDGSYRYMRDLPNARVGDDFPEAAGRGPACAFALHRGGRADLARIRPALAAFLEHRPAFRKEWHKALCHTAPEGFGSHYLFFDYLFAARAARVLPKSERERARLAILEDVLGERFADGSFEDIPLLGRAYGTAMALMILRELRAG